MRFPSACARACICVLACVCTLVSDFAEVGSLVGFRTMRGTTSTESAGQQHLVRVRRIEMRKLCSKYIDKPPPDPPLLGIDLVLEVVGGNNPQAPELDIIEQFRLLLPAQRLTRAGCK